MGGKAATDPAISEAQPDSMVSYDFGHASEEEEEEDDDDNFLELPSRKAMQVTFPPGSRVISSVNNDSVMFGAVYAVGIDIATRDTVYRIKDRHSPSIYTYPEQMLAFSPMTPVWLLSDNGEPGRAGMVLSCDMNQTVLRYTVQMTDPAFCNTTNGQRYCFRNVCPENVKVRLAGEEVPTQRQQKIPVEPGTSNNLAADTVRMGEQSTAGSIGLEDQFADAIDVDKSDQATLHNNEVRAEAVVPFVDANGDEDAVIPEAAMSNGDTPSDTIEPPVVCVVPERSPSTVPLASSEGVRQPAAAPSPEQSQRVALNTHVSKGNISASACSVGASQEDKESSDTNMTNIPRHHDRHDEDARESSIPDKCIKEECHDDRIAHKEDTNADSSTTAMDDMNNGEVLDDKPIRSQRKQFVDGEVMESTTATSSLGSLLSADKTSSTRASKPNNPPSDCLLATQAAVRATVTELPNDTEIKDAMPATKPDHPGMLPASSPFDTNSQVSVALEEDQSSSVVPVTMSPLSLPIDKTSVVHKKRESEVQLTSRPSKKRAHESAVRIVKIPKKLGLDFTLRVIDKQKVVIREGPGACYCTLALEGDGETEDCFVIRITGISMDWVQACFENLEKLFYSTCDVYILRGLIFHFTMLNHDPALTRDGITQTDLQRLSTDPKRIRRKRFTTIVEIKDIPVERIGINRIHYQSCVKALRKRHRGVSCHFCYSFLHPKVFPHFFVSGPDFQIVSKCRIELVAMLPNGPGSCKFPRNDTGPPQMAPPPSVGVSTIHAEDGKGLEEMVSGFSPEEPPENTGVHDARGARNKRSKPQTTARKFCPSRGRGTGKSGREVPGRAAVNRNTSRRPIRRNEPQRKRGACGHQKRVGLAARESVRNRPGRGSKMGQQRSRSVDLASK